jgi:diphthine-ammonia ligase
LTGTVAVLYSGGKDSTFTIAKLSEEGYDVICLITVISENYSSYMLHTSNIQMTKLTSEALGIPLCTGSTRGVKENELLDIRHTIMTAKKEYGFDSLASGGMASAYQKERIESVAKECGLSVMSPLWGIDQERYLRILVADCYEFIITSVSAEGLDNRWLGKRIGKEEIEELIELSRKNRFNIAFEGGEAETLVLDCPIFRKRLRILDADVDWNGYYGFFRIKKAVLEEKAKPSSPRLEQQIQ